MLWLVGCHFIKETLEEVICWHLVIFSEVFQYFFDTFFLL